MYWPCPIKKILGLACPGCGMTRSLTALMKLDLVSSLKYNLLGIPFVIFLLILIPYLIKNHRKVLKTIEEGILNHKFLIFSILIINMIINIIRGI